MSQYVDGPKSFSCSGALAQHLRVKTPTSLAAAGALDREIGTLDRAALATGDSRTVRLRTAPGTSKFVAAGVITAGNLFYGAAGGKVSETNNGNLIGIALETTTANNDVFEGLRMADGRAASDVRSVEAHTAGDTLLAAESGSAHTNTGASGTITLVLPVATVGLEFFFALGAAQELRLDPNGSETISLPSTGVPGTGGNYLVADLIGETVHLVCCVAGNWNVIGYTGTWAAEG